MKRFILIALLVTGAARADVAGETVDGYYACLSEKWLDEFMKFAVEDDVVNFQTYLDRKICIFPMKGGVSVTINDVGEKVHGFLYQGTQLYAPAQALKTQLSN